MRVVAIGRHTLRNCVVLAPMAGVTDVPFRELAWDLGAGLVVAEMTSVNPQLWNTRTSRLRRETVVGIRPRVVQIAGADPAWIAAAARREADAGADVIDVNMGCPAKKVCNQAAGSALLRDEALVERILRSAVDAVDVPVTVKIRTGWSPDERNGVMIAKIAQDAGVASIAVHGRTRACRFVGDVEYDTIAAIKAALAIPVFANGDIADAEQARRVLAYTNADGVLVGRAALGAPWLPGDIAEALATGRVQRARGAEEILPIAARHLAHLHAFYGDEQGVRIARKHVKAYLQRLQFDAETIGRFNALERADEQRCLVDSLVERFWPRAA
ncbi:MAG TPA: tRNA dihydrouridine synthase DusB [Pseudomonadales bacterium]|nr:tRNA dihydrouridine synthase DusB [Pseudomonadales bacterium]